MTLSRDGLPSVASHLDCHVQEAASCSSTASLTFQQRASSSSYQCSVNKSEVLQAVKHIICVAASFVFLPCQSACQVVGEAEDAAVVLVRVERSSC
jgi:hypothetical protein